MPKLVEEGHVYITQPPLYKIKRGQREEYIQTEQQMDEMLLDLGREGRKVFNCETFPNRKGISEQVDSTWRKNGIYGIQ